METYYFIVLLYLLTYFCINKSKCMNRFIKFIVLSFAVCLIFPTAVSAQQVSIGSNIMDWVNHGTANISISSSIGAHVTAGATARYNPWVFNEGTSGQVNHGVRGGSVDVRYWPWHVYSGWWVMAKGQALEYNYGNLFGTGFSEQGYAYGGGFGTGYALMLGTHWNVDFGATFWGGKKYFSRYDCAYCGKPVDEGEKWFLLPDNLYVSFYLIF